MVSFGGISWSGFTTAPFRPVLHKWYGFLSHGYGLLVVWLLFGLFSYVGAMMYSTYFGVSLQTARFWSQAIGFFVAGYAWSLTGRFSLSYASLNEYLSVCMWKWVENLRDPTFKDDKEKVEGKGWDHKWYFYLLTTVLTVGLFFAATNVGYALAWGNEVDLTELEKDTVFFSISGAYGKGHAWAVEILWKTVFSLVTLHIWLCAKTNDGHYITNYGIERKDKNGTVIPGSGKKPNASAKMALNNAQYSVHQIAIMRGIWFAVFASHASMTGTNLNEISKSITGAFSDDLNGVGVSYLTLLVSVAISNVIFWLFRSSQVRRVTKNRRIDANEKLIGDITHTPGKITYDSQMSAMTTDDYYDDDGF